MASAAKMKNPVPFMSSSSCPHLRSPATACSSVEQFDEVNNLGYSLQLSAHHYEAPKYSLSGGHIGFIFLGNCEGLAGPLVAPLATPIIIASKCMSLSQMQKELRPF